MFAKKSKSSERFIPKFVGFKHFQDIDMLKHLFDMDTCQSCWGWILLNLHLCFQQQHHLRLLRLGNSQWNEQRHTFSVLVKWWLCYCKNDFINKIYNVSRSTYIYIVVWRTEPFTKIQPLPVSGFKFRYDLGGTYKSWTKFFFYNNEIMKSKIC